jgi:hypothetical protein
MLVESEVQSRQKGKQTSARFMVILSLGRDAGKQARRNPSF